MHKRGNRCFFAQLPRTHQSKFEEACLEPHLELCEPKWRDEMQSSRQWFEHGNPFYTLHQLSFEDTSGKVHWHTSVSIWLRPSSEQAHPYKHAAAGSYFAHLYASAKSGKAPAHPSYPLCSLPEAFSRSGRSWWRIQAASLMRRPSVATPTNTGSHLCVPIMSTR